MAIPYVFGLLEVFLVYKEEMCVEDQLHRKCINKHKKCHWFNRNMSFIIILLISEECCLIYGSQIRCIISHLLLDSMLYFMTKKYILMDHVHTFNVMIIFTVQRNQLLERNFHQCQVYHSCRSICLKAKYMIVFNCCA